MSESKDRIVVLGLENILFAGRSERYVTHLRHITRVN